MVRNTAILIGIGAFVLMLIIFNGMYTVNEGERGVILRLGSVQGVAAPGLNFKVPFINSVEFMSVRDQKEEFAQVSSYSKDVQEAVLKLSVIYRVPEDKVDEVYARFGTDYFSRVVEPVVPQRLKEVFGQYQAATVVADRSRLGLEAEKAIRDTVAANSNNLIEIRSVQIENIDFSDAYETAIEGAMQAEAEVRKSRNELERIRVEAEKAVVTAKGAAESVREAAKAEADAIRLRGDAQASAVKAKGEALKDNPNLVTLIAVEKWNGVLPTTQVPGSAVPFITVPQNAPTTSRMPEQP